MKEIRRKSHKKHENEEGATLVIVALVMTVLISMFALVVDLGYAYYNRSLLQASCDAAALAAANYLEKEPAYTRADVKTIGKNCFNDNMNANMSSETQEQYDLVNDADRDYQIIEEGGKAVKIIVTATLKSPTGFATIFGVDHVDVGAYAIAEARQGPRDSIWRYALFSEGDFGFSTGNINVVGAIGSNGSINLGGAVTNVYDTDPSVPYPEIGKIAAGTTVGGANNVNHGTIIENAPSYDFDACCSDFDSWVNSNLLFNPSSLTVYSESPGSMDSGIAPGWTYVTYGGNQAVQLQSPVAYNCDFGMTPSGCNTIIIPANSKMYVHGNAYFGCHLIIEKGATVHVMGNCTIGNDLTCTGNIIIEGNLSISGGGLSSEASPETSIIYVKGSSVSLGEGGTNMDGVMIVCPNNTSFSLNGGSGTTVKGSIVAKTLGDLGSGGITVTYPGDRNPWEKDINGVRLVE